MTYKDQKKVKHPLYGTGRMVTPPDANGIVIIGYLDGIRGSAVTMNINEPGEWTAVPLSTRVIGMQKTRLAKKLKTFEELKKNKGVKNK